MTNHYEVLAKSFLNSGLFEARYYAIQAGLTFADEYAAALHYISHAAPGVDVSELFSGEDYYARNADVKAAGANALEHFLRHGVSEGRHAFSERKCEEFFSASQETSVLDIGDILPPGTHVVVRYAQNGNFFFTDIARYVAVYLAKLGLQTSIMSDADDVPPAFDHLELVVAPHEYMTIGAGRDWDSERIANASYLNTEQWQTQWFAKCFRHLLLSRPGVLDMNLSSAKGLAKLGVRSAFLPLFPLPGTPFVQERSTLSRALLRKKHVERLSYTDDLSVRPYDILFVANLNDRRKNALAALSGALAQQKCFLHCPEILRPIYAGDPDILTTRDFTQIAKNSKILLNIHRDEVGYFEWHRLFLYGVCNGAVVLTEPCFYSPLICAGEHYIEATLEEMPALIHALLATEAGIQRLRTINQNCSALLSRLMMNDWRI